MTLLDVIWSSLSSGWIAAGSVAILLVLAEVRRNSAMRSYFFFLCVVFFCASLIAAYYYYGSEFREANFQSDEGISIFSHR
ncbi:hypothetical protein [Parvularcula bermudensis]|nr:hypothetical protein [Parvularcula bermudensis]